VVVPTGHSGDGGSMQVIIAAEVPNEKYEKFKLAIELAKSECDAFDYISKNYRSVSGRPLFDDGFIKKFRREIQDDECDRVG